MFNNFFASLKISQNIEKVKTGISSAFTVLTKIISLLNLLNTEYGASEKFAKYVPAVLSSLVAIVTIITKFAPLLGINLTTAQVSADLTKDEALAELEKSLNDLKDATK